MREEPARPEYAIGRVRTSARDASVVGYRVIASAMGKILDETITDGSGRFLLEWKSRGPGPVLVELLGASGEALQRRELPEDELWSPPAITFETDETRTIHGRGGETQVVFLADGDRPVRVEAGCHPVALTWEAPAESKVTLTSGGELLGRGLHSQGTLTVKESTTKTYGLSVETHAGGEPLPAVTLQIRRYPSISLFFEDNRIVQDSVVKAGISIGCPAGRGGVEVTLLPDDASRLHPARVTIEEGSTWAPVEIRTGKKGGRAEMTAFAHGYLRDMVVISVE